MNWAIKVDLPGRVRRVFKSSKEMIFWSKKPYLKEVNSLLLLTLSISFKGAISSSWQKAMAVGWVSFWGNLIPSFSKARVMRVFLTTSK